MNLYAKVGWLGLHDDLLGPYIAFSCAHLTLRDRDAGQYTAP
jgi:hypothetical protein